MNTLDTGLLKALVIQSREFCVQISDGRRELQLSQDYRRVNDQKIWLAHILKRITY